MKMYVYMLDLKDDEKGIAEYLEAHKNVEPRITENMDKHGVIWAQVLRKGTRLVEFILTNDSFDPAAFDADAAADPACVRWNEDMKAYQVPMPFAADGEWWTPAEVAFDFHNWDNI